MKRVSLQLTIRMILGVLILGSVSLRGEEDPPDGDPPPPVMAPTMPAAKPAVQEEKSVWKFRDEQGELVLVPDFSYEEWDRLDKIKNGLAAPSPPPVTIARVTATGTVAHQEAELDVQIELRVRTDLSTPFPIPLNFRTAILADQQVRYQGSGSQYLHYTGEQGYVCWLQADADTVHTLQFRLIRPVTEVSGQQRLSVHFPEARSTLTLDIALDSPKVSIKPREATLTVTPSDSGKGSRIVVDGVGGTQELQWRPRLKEVADNEPLISSVASITVNVEGQQYITSEATLDVRTFRGEIESFDVELPRGMKLVSRQESGYRVENLPAENKSQPPRIRVTFDRKSERPAKVYLFAELSREADMATAPFDAAGFRILGARHQRGDVTVLVHGDWAVRPIEMSNMQRITSDLASDANESRFLFHQQPCTLQLAVLSRESRINVEPTYALHVVEGQVRLTARLLCQVRGEKAFGLDIDMAEWEVDKVSPTTLVEDSIDLQRSQPLTIPFSERGQISKGEFLLEIKAHRDLDAKNPTLDLALPKPQTGVVAKSTVVNTTPATVYISAADNVQLSPQASDIQGLLKDSLSEELDLAMVPELMQAPLVYRTNAEEARFVAEYAIQPGSVTVGVDARVHIGEQQASCRQWLRYRIAYEAINQVVLECPRAPVENNTLDITLDGDILPYTMIPATEAEGEEGLQNRVRIQVNLLRELIGPCELELNFDQPLALAGEADLDTQQIPIGLVIPAEDQQTITSTTLQLQVADGLQADVQPDPWKVAPRTAGDSSMRQYTAKGAADSVTLQVALTNQPATSNIVHRCFVHSWWTPQGRRDRAAFLITPNDNRATIELPAGALESDDQMLVAINGRRALYDISRSGQLSVELPASSHGINTVVEVWYTLPSKLSTLEPATWDIPRIRGTRRLEGFFWRVTVPRDRVLIAAPQMTPAFEWAWDQGWGRQPTMHVQELEEWIRGEATTAETARIGPAEQSAAATRHYLFSSFGQPQEITVHFASQQLLVLAGAGGTLLAGLLLIYLPGLRHPALLLVAGLALCVVGSYVPDLALLLLPVAAFGLAMVILSLVLSRLLSRRTRGRNVLQGTTEVKRDSDVVESKVRRRESPSHATTATIPAGPSLSPVESKP